MTGFRVVMQPGGWTVTDGVVEHGPYPTSEQAALACDNLNLQQRPEEPRSFAPLDEGLKADGSRDEGLDIPVIEMDQIRREAIERARVGGTDSAAAGSASIGGGLV